MESLILTGRPSAVPSWKRRFSVLSSISVAGRASSTVAVDAGLPFVDQVVEPFCTSWATISARSAPSQAAGHRLRGFRQRVPVLGAVELHFFFGPFIAALQDDRVDQRHVLLPILKAPPLETE